MTITAASSTGTAIWARLKPAADMTTSSLSELSLLSENNVPAK